MFITDNKKPSFLTIGQQLDGPDFFCDLYRFFKTFVIMGGRPIVDGHYIKTVCPQSLSTVILMTQRC